MPSRLLGYQTSDVLQTPCHTARGPRKVTIDSRSKIRNEGEDNRKNKNDQLMMVLTVQILKRPEKRRFILQSLNMQMLNL